MWSAQRGSDGHYHSQASGTGFFVKPDGTALTASHVVYEAVHDPEHYRLMAIVGHEFFDATVRCASRLPYDPTKPDPNSGVLVSRDVAEIKLSPSTFPFKEREREIGAEWFVTATAHTDLLPDFPFLTIGGNPQGHVRVIGFGHISPIPYKWTAEGRVDKYFHENETDFFDVRFVSPPQSGNSGSPVLDDQNRVVGLLVWLYTIHRDMAIAQAPSAFRNPCP
jgi:V8-like Glu-specific endopeptidase